MAKLKNVFSWSHSAAGDFEDCRRRRYYSKYAHWSGWERGATPLQKTAYRLNKMTSRYGLQGQAAELAVMWMLNEHQFGRERSVDEAFNEIARPFLRRHWDESTSNAWVQRAKACCLHEHYYPEFHPGTEKERMIQVADTIKLCLQNFKEKVLPRLAAVTPAQEIPISVVGQGDPENFLFEGRKIYAIPDYVYVQDDVWHIIDWKSGKVKEEHQQQILGYALWAKVKHGIPPERIVLSLEYLQTGESKTFTITQDDLDGMTATIHESMQDMAQYLVDTDLDKNEAMPIEEWDMAYDPGLCHWCKFYELCKKELTEVEAG